MSTRPRTFVYAGKPLTVAQYRRETLKGVSEDSVQRECVALLEELRQAGQITYTAVNPIPAKSVRAASISKALGLRKGFPDFVLCWCGRFIAIEVKRPVGGQLSDAQQSMREEILLSGGIWHLVKSAAELREFLSTIMARRAA